MIAGSLSAAYATRFAVLTLGPGPRDAGRHPSRAEIAALGSLTLITLLLCALWWPPAGVAAARLLGQGLPPAEGMAGTTAALVLAGLGVLTGAAMARAPAPHTGADWLGLPWLIEAAVIRPALRLAGFASWIDDAVLDGMSRSAARTGALALIVRLAEASANAAGRFGERLTDLIPEGTGRLIGSAGTNLRRTQTGLSHHYYVIFVAGFALGTLFLILGA